MMIIKEVTETESILAYHDDVVPDPDLEIRGGEGSSRPLDKGGRAVSKKKLAFLASVWSKNKGAGPFPGSATVMTENNTGPICFQRNDQCFWVSLLGILMSLEI